MKPNIFDYATSELSQDSFLCWLLSWADGKHSAIDPAIHALGVSFLTSIYEEARKQPPTSYQTVEVRRQDGGSDILCIVNNDTAILIEDKIGTKQHSDQLSRYKKHVEQLGFTPDKILLVYLQTGDQGDYSAVVKQGYVVHQRLGLLKLLESPVGRSACERSDIVSNYTAYLRRVEDQVQSFRQLPPQNWSWNSWKGFYTELQRVLGDGCWDYVPNPSGGFLGFWWHFVGDSKCEQYLQLEQNRFCFKIAVDHSEKRKELRDLWHQRIVDECNRQGLKVARPGRFGNGSFMTVAILDTEWPAVESHGLVDLSKSLELMRKAEAVLDAATACEPNSVAGTISATV